MRNLKRALSLALASVMLLGMMVMGSSAASYPDVDQTNNLEAIDVLQMLGLMEGDEKGNFNPDGTVTRYQMSALVCKLLGLTPGGNIPFTDFGASDNWAKPYVAACYNQGIVSGTSATTFDGGRSVTAVEAGLMIMRTLNYFYNQSELGTDWKLATIREANAIDLYRGINAYTDQIMDRDNIAQMVLNALESNVVVARQDTSINVQTGDVTVDVQGQWRYEAAENNTTKDYRGTSDKLMQLCEKLYGNDLRKNEDGTNDAMGRPSSQWTYKGSSVASPNEPDLTYVKAVKGKDIYADLGKPSGLKLVTLDDAASVYVDGEQEKVSDVSGDGEVITKNTFNVAAGRDEKIGGDGLIVEVYYDNTKDEGAENLTLVVVTPYVGQIDDVDENDDGERIVKVNGLEFVTNAFEEDDWVIYTQDVNAEKADRIQSMYALEVQTGTLTKKTGSNKYTIDGKEYTAAGYDNEVDPCDVKDEVDFYLDANGYIAKMEVSEGVVSVDNLAYVIEAKDARGDYAELRLADGSKKTVDTDKLYDGSDGDDLRGKIVSFKENKGEYKLTDRTTIEGTGTETIAFKKGQPTITLGTSDNIATDSKTVFVYSVAGDVTVYTGYKNAPSIDADSDLAVAYCKDDNKNKAAVMVYVQVNAKTEVGGSDDLTFIAYDKDVKFVDEGDDVEYYEYNAVVDGKIDVVRVKANLNADLAASGAKIQVYSKLSTDSDDIAEKTGSATATASDDYWVATSVSKVQNETISMSTGTFAYADDVKVFFVDDDFNIREGSITDVKACDDTTDADARYSMILYTVDDDNADTITQIVIMEN